ncbi:hypothetical protein D3C87_2120550 [compost metagenome]
MEGDVRAQEEGPFQAICRCLPALGQRGQDRRLRVRLNQRLRDAVGTKLKPASLRIEPL